MKERPILFSAPMVRALLDGSKTQTRRIVKMRQSDWCKEIKGDCWNPNEIAEWRLQDGRWFGLMGWYTLAFADCPYGQIGDQLWVRETWAHGIHALNAKRDEDGPFVYAATDSEQHRLGDRWKPGIHMFRYASRITLEVISVRMERLQDISRGDAMAEGCPFPNMAQGDDPRKWYADLWESINDPNSWNLNPWVWVINFKQVTT